MAAADAPYQHLPMELRPPYHTHREEIASTSQRYHCLIFPTAGSPSVAYLRNYPKTNDISPSMAVAFAQYEHLPTELWPQYCTKRVATPSASCGYTEIFFLRLVLRRLLTSASASALFTNYMTINDAAATHDNVPWSYGHDITPRESISPLLYTTTIRLFFLRLVLRRWHAYASS